MRLSAAFSLVIVAWLLACSDSTSPASATTDDSGDSGSPRAATATPPPARRAKVCTSLRDVSKSVGLSSDSLSLYGSTWDTEPPSGTYELTYEYRSDVERGSDYGTLRFSGGFRESVLQERESRKDRASFANGFVTLTPYCNSNDQLFFPDEIRSFKYVTSLDGYVEYEYGAGSTEKVTQRVYKRISD